MVGIGIIGCGSIAIARHVPEYHARNDCRINGYYDPVAERPGNWLSSMEARFTIL